MSVPAPCTSCLRRSIRHSLRPQLAKPTASQSRLLSSTPTQWSPAPLPQPSPKKKPPPQPAAYKPQPATTSFPTSPSSSSSPSTAKPSASTSPSLRAASELRTLAPAFTETYVAYGVTEVLLKECARQAAYTTSNPHGTNAEIPKSTRGEDIGVGQGWWYETLKLQPTFSTWAQVTFLHMYILTVRLRTFPPQHAPQWHQHLVDHFSYAAEARMAQQHGIVSRIARNKYLKDLFMQWKGVQMAYDEGLIRGDAVLAAAVWRNLFGGDEEVDLKGLAQVVAFLRKGVVELGELPDDVVARGQVGFGDPGELEGLVMARAKGMDRPFEGEGVVEGGGGGGGKVKEGEDGEAIRAAMGAKEHVNA